MSFSISDGRIIDRGALIATFKVTLTTGTFLNAVTFEARLLYGPHGYFALPVNIRDQAGYWQRPFSLSRSFCKAICAAALEALNLNGSGFPPYVAPEPDPVDADLEPAE
jgi:hypothetical protein